MYRITKTYACEVAHRIHNQKLVYDKIPKCKWIHGHSAKITVALTAVALNEESMVIDYGNLNPLRKFINSVLDHRLLLYRNDPMLKEMCPGLSERLHRSKADNFCYNHYRDGDWTDSIVLTNKPTTSESLAQMLYDEFSSLLAHEGVYVTLESVTYQEGESSSATYFPDDAPRDKSYKIKAEELELDPFS